MSCYDCEYHKGVIRELEAHIIKLQGKETTMLSKIQELQATNEQLQRGIIDDKDNRHILVPRELDDQNENIKEVLGKCVEPILRYKSCLMAYAGESAHKGNRDDQSFWETRAKTISTLQGEMDIALLSADPTDSPELQKAAEKASRTGTKEDLHEYLKLRRNFI